MLKQNVTPTIIGLTWGSIYGFYWTPNDYSKIKDCMLCGFVGGLMGMCGWSGLMIGGVSLVLTELEDTRRN